MINMYEVSETNKMIEHENLDVRTITLGISLLDCIDSDLDELNRKIYEKITTVAKVNSIMGFVILLENSQTRIPPTTIPNTPRYIRN